jgi:acetoin utilization protein AcuB
MACAMLDSAGMSKTIPAVRKFMSTTPFTIEPDQSLFDAHEVMREKHIRHLPVCEGAKVVGILSDGDLYRAESVMGADPKSTKVRDVMVAKPFSVTPDAPIDEVVQEMAGKKFGSAVVLDNGRVVGLFTATDALGAFAELLQTRLKH